MRFRQIFTDSVLLEVGASGGSPGVGPGDGPGDDPGGDPPSTPTASTSDGVGKPASGAGLSGQGSFKPAGGIFIGKSPAEEKHDYTAKSVIGKGIEWPKPTSTAQSSAVYKNDELEMHDTHAGGDSHTVSEDADASSTSTADIATVSYPLFVRGASRRARRRNARKAVGQKADSAPSYIGRGVYESNLKEFAPVGRGPWGDNDSGEDPYKHPKPRHYGRSIDFFGQFEADHFDREDMNDATGEFKGYWGKNQIAYFKFDNPKRTGSDDPGMGWYYEPADDGSTGPQIKTDDNFRAYLAQRKQQELSMIDAFLKSGQKAKPGSQIHSLMKRHGMAEGSMNEFVLPGGGSDGDSGSWYTDDELADIIGDDWFEDFDVSNDGFNIDTHGEKAKQNLVGYANSWFDDKGYNVNVLGVEHNDVDHDLKWYIVGSFRNDGVAESDPSGIMHAAKNYNKSFLITAELAEGGKKTFRVRAQSERVARDKFDQHYNQATILKVKEEGVAEAHTLNSDSVIYRLDREKPMSDTEVLVIGGAGRYTLQGLRDKARKEAEELAQDLKIEHGGAFRRSADNIKQLTNTLNTIVAAYNELRRIRTKGGRGSRGITDEDTNFIRECMTVVEQWHTIQGKK